MQAANGVTYVVTSFRSVSRLIGTELACTSRSQQSCRDALTGAKCWQTISNTLRQCTGTATPQAVVIQADCRHQLQSKAWSSVTLLSQQAMMHTRSPISSTKQSTLQKGLLWAQKQHQSFQSQASKSSWSRNYYSSGYSRGYGSYWDGEKVLYGLIAANCAGYFLWQSDPSLMRRHATVSVNSIREGRIYTLLTSAFSHASLNHLFANMFTFYFFGREIGLTFGGKKVAQAAFMQSMLAAYCITFSTLGRTSFAGCVLQLLALYVAGGLAGSLAHVAFFYFKAQSTGMTAWYSTSQHQG